MNAKTETSTAAQRAEALVSYLEEKTHLPEDIPEHLRPKALQTDIEEALSEIEQAAQELKGSK